DAAPPSRGPATPGRTVNFKVRRCDGPGKPGRWETFAVTVERGSNVISCLQQIAANPVTVEGTRTTPVVWDSGCLEEVCGACTMVINGKVRQSCSCLIDNYAPGEGDTITLEPMQKFPVVRDLWVDRSRMFSALRRLKTWVPIDGTYSQGAGPKETPDDQEIRYKLSECMTCGCCVDACPQFLLEPDPARWETSFVGAHAVSLARLFNEHPTGRTLAPHRLEVLSGHGGINDCGNAQNCVKVCPKHIPLTESIGQIGRAVTVHQIKKIFFARPDPHAAAKGPG
ncbi:MAG: succinate dehydrogenase iron-sulfur subunit, partial [Phycisphaerales bacterium]|nr:succinate dehydrogenase iron-sulfur subunit [Phycisphaerales bacterium]